MRTGYKWLLLLLVNTILASVVSWFGDEGFNLVRRVLGMEPLPIGEGTETLVFFAVFIFLTCAELVVETKTTHDSSNAAFLRRLNEEFREMKVALVEEIVSRALQPHALEARGIAPAALVRRDVYLDKWGSEMARIGSEGVMLDSDASVALTRVLAESAGSFRWVETAVHDVDKEWTLPFRNLLSDIKGREVLQKECILLLEKDIYTSDWQAVRALRKYLMSVGVRAFWSDLNQVRTSFATELPELDCLEQFGLDIFLGISDLPAGAYAGGEKFRIRVLKVGKEHPYARFMRCILGAREPIGTRPPA